ncbi:DUF1186 domain-containing protein [Dankookia sp. P2]|uniref:DUF1186 domain-containing protein n=1 Tax=Dankookia sp. P2 TaxID=3423955 RepID=UPI003D67FCB4
MDDILHAFASAGEGFPRAAMEQALSRWEAAAPPLLAALASFAEGRERGEAAASAALHVIYLAAQARERRAFPLLLRLARDAEALDATIGDGLTEDFPGILAACFDGDLEGLLALVLDGAADEMVRHAAIEALTLLFATCVLPMARAEPVLRELHGRLLLAGEAPDWVWVGWQQAVAMLGTRPAAGGGDGAVPRREDRPLDHVCQGFRGRPEGRPGARHRPAGAAGGAGRYAARRCRGAFRRVAAPAREEEVAKRAARAARAAVAPTTAVNPNRDVGRNDSCPCGSGKKFKKCCLAA